VIFILSKRHDKRTFTQIIEVKSSRKEYTCDKCGEVIYQRSGYYRKKGMTVDGDFFDLKLCVNCAPPYDPSGGSL